MDNEEVKVEKLLQRLKELSDNLHLYRKDNEIRERIDLYYYVQKETELKILGERLDEVHKLLKFVRQSLGSEYKEVYQQWRKDVRWLNRYLLQDPPDQSAKEIVSVS